MTDQNTLSSAADAASRRAGPVGTETDDHPDRAETDDRAGALKRTLRFTYHYSTVLVPLSVVWFFTSLPIVTAGPATLGVYATVLSLRETGGVDRQYVRETIRRNVVHATLLGLIPPMFLAIAALNVLGGGSALVAVLAFYVGTYLTAVLIATFIGLARGEAVVPALRESYVWTAKNPAVTAHLVVVTLVVTVAGVLLTIGFVLLFAGFLATYHVEIVTDEPPAVDPGTATAQINRVVP